jgi:hypothetical protein
MGMSLTISTVDFGRITAPEYVSARSEKPEHPDPFGTVVCDLRHGGSLTIYMNDPAKGRRLAEVILQACDETEQERATRAALLSEDAPLTTSGT